MLARSIPREAVPKWIDRSVGPVQSLYENMLMVAVQFRSAEAPKPGGESIQTNDMEIRSANETNTSARVSQIKTVL